jgi:hypothetical protein
MLLATYLLHIITLGETNVLQTGTKGPSLGSVIFHIMCNSNQRYFFKSKDPPETSGQRVHET